MCFVCVFFLFLKLAFSLRSKNIIFECAILLIFNDLLMKFPIEFDVFSIDFSYGFLLFFFVIPIELLWTRSYWKKSESIDFDTKINSD